MHTTQWNSELAVGEPELDAAHRELFTTLQHLAGLAPEQFPAAYDQAVADIESDFRAEESLMEQLAYPSLACHREQHARALSGLHHAAAALAQGNAGPAHHAIALLGDWLHLHITTMDQALALAIALSRSPASRPS
jgi:hemerythrin-like metal-binding protein